jgi:uncharacterized protein with beta-barrel porin domain
LIESAALTVAGAAADAVLATAAADLPDDPAASPREHAATNKRAAASSTATRRKLLTERYDIVVLESTYRRDTRQIGMLRAARPKALPPGEGAG